MIGKSALTAAVLAAGMILGCESKELHSGIRQEGDLATQDWTWILRSPYSPILGDTTGGGLPRDMRTGGGISGNDVTVYDRLKAGRTLPPAQRPTLNPTTRIPPPPELGQTAP